MADNDTFALIVEELGYVFQPLEDAFSSFDAFEAYLMDLGWSPKVLPTPISDLVQPNGPVRKIANAIQKLESGGATGPFIADLLDGIQGTFKDLMALKNATFDPSLGVEFATEFPMQLIEALIVDYLVEHHPTIAFFLRAFGIIQIQFVDATANRPYYLKRQIAWADFPTLFKDPSQVLVNLYDWGKPTFDYDGLVANVYEFVSSLGLSTYFERLDGKVSQSLEDGADVPGNPLRRRLKAPLFVQGDDNGNIEAGLGLFYLPQVQSIMPGIALLPYVEGQLGDKFEIYTNFYLSLLAKFDLQGGLGLKLRPGQPLEAVIGFDDPSGVSKIDGMAQAKVDYQREDGQPIVLLGQDQGTRFQLDDVSGAVGMSLGSDKPTDIYLELALQGAKIFVVPSQDDGFLSKVLPKDGFDIVFEMAAGWSRVNGFYFHGSAGLEVTLPLDLSLLGVVTIDSVYLGVLANFNPPSLDLAVAASVSVTLGPVYASIEEMGLRAELSFPSDGGNLGPANLDLKFKPPKGVAIDVDASAVQGGGYLFFDEDHGQYGGVLMLSIEETITVKAIALITTKLPDGSSGFSMLIIISAEFTPIQLGFGFTLNGVGGLAGINRTIVTEALQAGIKNHAVDHIMFPKDPIQNAKQIISDLNTFFPPAEDRYIFGPMIMIGYEIFVIAELGVIIEVPSPVVIVILGQINVGLPIPEEAIIEIHLDVIGILDFGKKFFSLDASMHDSRLLLFSMYGDMALRLNWGENSNFALSIGGLNPHYQPPPGFPTLKRFTVSLCTGDNPRLGLQAYMAITSNTFQTGAAAFLYVGLGPVEIDGHLGFDALFIFKPFSFIVDFSAGISLKVGGLELLGIHLDATLSGPSPWHAWGTASISFFFFSLSVHVDITIGDGSPQPLPILDPTPDLLKALSDPRNWSGVLPEQAFQAVSLVSPELKASSGQANNTASSPMVYIDPIGGLQIKQKVLPLGQTLQKVGENQPPPDRNHFSITKLDITNSLGGLRYPPLPLEEDDDLFAPAQFFEFSDNEKLSQPSFSRYNSGAKLSADLLDHGDAQGVPFSYQTEILDSEIASRKAALYVINFQQQQHALQRSAAAQAPSRNSGGNQFLSDDRTQPQAIIVQDPQYVAFDISSNEIRSDIVKDPLPKVDARSKLSQYLDLHPNEAENLEIITVDEASQLVA